MQYLVFLLNDKLKQSLQISAYKNFGYINCLEYLKDQTNQNFCSDRLEC